MVINGVFIEDNVGNADLRSLCILNSYVIYGVDLILQMPNIILYFSTPRAKAHGNLKKYFICATL